MLSGIREYYNERVEDLTPVNGRHDHIFKWFDRLIGPSLDVLDVGCGTGITSRYLASKGASVVAVDIADKLIERAREQDTANIEYMVADCTQMRLDKIFQAITIVDCIEHLPRTQVGHFLRNLVDHADDETFIYVNMPDGRFLKSLKIYYPEKAQIVDEAYSPGQVLNLFKSVGFEVVQSELYGLDSPFQYMSFLFISTSKMKKVHRDRLNKLYQSG